LKARLIGPRAVVQVVRESSLAFKNQGEEELSRRIQDPATLAWNLCTTAFLRLEEGRGSLPRFARESVTLV